MVPVVRNDDETCFGFKKNHDGLLKEPSEAPTGSWVQSAVDRWRGFRAFGEMLGACRLG